MQAGQDRTPASPLLPSAPHYPFLFISDTHMGIENGAIHNLLRFLHAIHAGQLTTKKIFWNGDIFDGWRRDLDAPGDLPEIQKKILDEVNYLSAELGIEHVYVSGNHDDKLRELGLAGKQALGVTFADRVILDLPGGGRALVEHGDACDPALLHLHRLPRGLARMGDRVYRVMLSASAALADITRQRLRTGFNATATVRHAVEHLIGFKKDFRARAVARTREAGCVVGIFGHNHTAEIARVDGTLYVNSGDCVESATCAAMTEQGAFVNLSYHDYRVDSAAARRCEAEAAEYRPRTEEWVAAIQRTWPGPPALQRKTPARGPGFP